MLFRSDPSVEDRLGLIELAAVQMLEAVMEVGVLGPGDQLGERLAAIRGQGQRFELLEFHVGAILQAVEGSPSVMLGPTRGRSTLVRSL